MFDEIWLNFRIRSGVCFVRRTLARSAFHGFSIGFQRCQWLFIFMIFCMLRSSYSYEYLKKRKLMDVNGHHETGQKGDFAVLTRTCRAACYLHHPGAVPRVTGFIF